MKRLVAIVVVAFVLASCSSAGNTSASQAGTPPTPFPATTGAGPTGSQAPTVDVANPCDYICLDTLDTSWGRIAVGTGWDEDAGLFDGYLTAWLVRDGRSVRTKLTTDNVDDVGVPQIVLWGDRAAIIATSACDRCRGSFWITSDGRTWDGPKAFSLPGESPAHLFVTSWGSRLVILGEQVPEDRRFASVWTSTDGETWQLGPRPPEWDDAIVTGWWEGGDGFVVGVGAAEQAGPPTEWPWTSANFVHWRPLGSPYPCTWTVPSFRSQECLPVSGRRPT